MPSVTAKRLCPDLVFVRPRFDGYKAISLQVRAVFAGHTDLVEPLSLDEAYPDVTANGRALRRQPPSHRRSALPSRPRRG